MSFLIIATVATAQTRSAQAWLDCGYEAAATYRLWPVLAHPTDDRAALIIPATPGEAQIGLSQEAYDDLLTDAERAALVADLSPDWTPEIF